jgi:hypothetical protein
MYSPPRLNFLVPPALGAVTEVRASFWRFGLLFFHHHGKDLPRIKNKATPSFTAGPLFMQQRKN